MKHLSQGEVFIYSACQQDAKTEEMKQKQDLLPICPGVAGIEESGNLVEDPGRRGRDQGTEPGIPVQPPQA